MQTESDPGTNEERMEFEGDSSFLVEEKGPMDASNRYKPRRKRRWVLQFLASGALLFILGRLVLGIFDSAWQHLRNFAFRILPDPIVEEIKKVEEELSDKKNAEKTSFGVQRGKLENEDEYVAYLESLELEVVKPEVVIRPHRNIRNGVSNELPPRRYWGRIKSTLLVVEALQKELGVPLRMINSAYRSPSYNKACSGAAKHSFHTRNNALDVVFACSPEKAGKAAIKIRSRGDFKGGIGVYSTFIHIDTRGKNTTWGTEV